jgi:PAS domain S-box-containing protein
MGSDLKKVIPLRARRADAPSSKRADAHIEELRAARRAALNLMEDAVLARRETEQLNVQLLSEVEQRRMSEARLSQSEERLRLLAESFQDYAIFTLDPAGEVITWNLGAANIFGYAEQEITGKSAGLLFVPEDRVSGVPDREMETARSTGRASDERWQQRKDGSRFYASGIMVPLRADDTLIGYAKIARDLTQEKQTEEELLQHREKLELLIAGRTVELAEANEILVLQMSELRRAEEERVALLQRVVTVQEDERRRIARDMHDSLGQQMTALRLEARFSLKTICIAAQRIDAGVEHLQDLGKRLDEEVNFLVWELRPTVLDDLGLAAAIENYVHEWTRHCSIAVGVSRRSLWETRDSTEIWKRISTGSCRKRSTMRTSIRRPET